MNKGDLVLIDYIGKTDGEVFDLTVEDKAKEEGMHSDEVDYSPIPVLVGEKYVIPGLDEVLMELDVGDEKEVEINAENAYGERSSDQIETYPEKEFEKQGVQVRPGEEIQVGRRRGRVVSKGSGRVRIDFNHPLAGKDLKYWVKVVEEVEDDEEKAEYIFEHRIGHGDYEIEDGVMTVETVHEHDGHKHELPEEMQEDLKEEIEEYTELEVEFVEEL